MCGISGVIATNNPAFDIILYTLKQLQNRGYDSAGICSLSSDGQIALTKYATTESSNALTRLEKDRELHMGMTGIGHTRWATHGAKTDSNSHPHASHYGKFVLSHNGIIENFSILKSNLETEGYVFQSQTDTEVIVNLLERNFLRDQTIQKDVKQRVVCAIEQTICQLEGTWGLTILCIDDPETLYCTRYGSPLLVGRAPHCSIVTSEQSAFSPDVDYYFALKNMDVCTITRNIDRAGTHTIDVSTKDEYVLKQTLKQHISTSPSPYPHWTLKEIYEQTESICRAISNGGRIINEKEVKLGGLDEHRDCLLQIENIILLGCGTSYNAGLFGLTYFKELCDFNT